MIGCVNEKQKVIKRTSEIFARLVLGSDRVSDWLTEDDRVTEASRTSEVSKRLVLGIYRVSD